MCSVIEIMEGALFHVSEPVKWPEFEPARSAIRVSCTIWFSSRRDEHAYEQEAGVDLDEEEDAVWVSEQAFEQMALGHIAMLAARRDPGRLLAAAAALRKRFKGTDQMRLPAVQVGRGSRTCCSAEASLVHTRPTRSASLHSTSFSNFRGL